MVAVIFPFLQGLKIFQIDSMIFSDHLVSFVSNDGRHRKNHQTWCSSACVPGMRFFFLAPLIEGRKSARFSELPFVFKIVFWEIMKPKPNSSKNVLISLIKLHQYISIYFLVYPSYPTLSRVFFVWFTQSISCSYPQLSHTRLLQLHQFVLAEKCSNLALDEFQLEYACVAVGNHTSKKRWVLVG